MAVLEDKVVGYGASGRNAGFAMTLMGLTLSITALRFGKEKAKQAHDFGHRAVDHIGQMVDAHSIDCDYEKPGLLTVAHQPRPRRSGCRRRFELAEKLGIEGLRWLDAHMMRAEVHSPTYLGARWEEQCALINPAKYVRGMKRRRRWSTASRCTSGRPWRRLTFGAAPAPGHAARAGGGGEGGVRHERLLGSLPAAAEQAVPRLHLHRPHGAAEPTSSWAASAGAPARGSRTGAT